MNLETDGEAPPTWDILTNIEVACASICCVLDLCGGSVCRGWMLHCAISAEVMVSPVKHGPTCVAVGIYPSSYWVRGH